MKESQPRLKQKNANISRIRGQDIISSVKTQLDVSSEAMVPIDRDFLALCLDFFRAYNTNKTKNGLTLNPLSDRRVQTPKTVIDANRKSAQFLRLLMEGEVNLSNPLVVELVQNLKNCDVTDWLSAKDELGHIHTCFLDVNLSALVPTARKFSGVNMFHCLEDNLWNTLHRQYIEKKSQYDDEEIRMGTLVTECCTADRPSENGERVYSSGTNFITKFFKTCNSNGVNPFVENIGLFERYIIPVFIIDHFICVVVQRYHDRTWRAFVVNSIADNSVNDYKEAVSRILQFSCFKGLFKNFTPANVHSTRAGLQQTVKWKVANQLNSTCGYHTMINSLFIAMDGKTLDMKMPDGKTQSLSSNAMNYVCTKLWQDLIFAYKQKGLEDTAVEFQQYLIQDPNIGEENEQEKHARIHRDIKRVAKIYSAMGQILDSYVRQDVPRKKFDHLGDELPDLDDYEFPTDEVVEVESLRPRRITVKEGIYTDDFVYDEFRKHIQLAVQSSRNVKISEQSNLLHVENIHRLAVETNKEISEWFNFESKEMKPNSRTSVTVLVLKYKIYSQTTRLNYLFETFKFAYE
eukprot:757588-Hanusia_phi.AAC.8